MRAFLDAVSHHAAEAPQRVAFRDDRNTLTRSRVLAEAGRLAAKLPVSARTIGVSLPNGCEWAVAQLACIASGRIVVPLPSFFSPDQSAHVMRDAGVDLVLTMPHQDVPTGVARLPVEITGAEGAPPAYRPGFGTIIYTSGTTGRPKGVRHESGQVGWSAAALARAIEANQNDRYLSVLPLALLLESICALVVAPLVGGSVQFDAAVSDSVGRGRPAGIGRAFELHAPTIGVLVPELLRAWLAELAYTRIEVPKSLRFLAVGGAAVPEGLAEIAWRAGIPVHEGYGLSECCSVVALNRPGQRVPGTVGRPLDGLSVALRDGEIFVDGPCVTDGYLGGGSASGAWATGDLGKMDAAGRLTVSGRRDAVIVLPSGRNVSPEWVETTILEDPRIICCAVVADGSELIAFVVPAPQAMDGFAKLAPEVVETSLSARCAGLPGYARPARVRLLSLEEARGAGLLTDNGRIRRQVARALLSDPLTFSPLPRHRDPNEITP